ncbi:MAG: RMD1 family protein [Leptolyngbya sp. IPPAS B-1204]|uniref:RMD1 family protein n=1 Tax=Leptolyngbya sp. NK1-12 TaxID=2547451 RepID=A0AA97AQ89_9CYAN|nr:RMD1 family protein [Elainella sp. C42_A2020_010]RNJ67652.1 MAG: RMD1 family protein [Leptolyngbya sp. IPPAS B-1204]WNZ23073.1 RMD1 family protein [Leptolyngbya sp. NK1-12]
MQKLVFNHKDTVAGRAIFLGERLDLKALEKTDYLATLPLAVSAGEQGCVVLFRYGAVVLYGLSPVEEASFLTYLKPLVVEPFASPETEEVVLKLDNSGGGGRVENGTIWLQSFSIECLQIVADVLAKSVVLAHYEVGTGKIFDQIEPFAESLQRTTKDERWGKELLRQLGRTLSIQHKIVGRVEIIDKPDLLWDAPDLERIYIRLENEYEIRERHLALERKLGLISTTAETVLDLLQHNTGLRVEWYVVILIVVEILLSFYDVFLQT